MEIDYFFTFLGIDSNPGSLNMEKLLITAACTTEMGKPVQMHRGPRWGWVTIFSKRKYLVMICLIFKRMPFDYINLIFGLKSQKPSQRP